MRECGLASTRALTSAASALASIQSTSVRGVIRPRTGRSPSRSTPEISWRSPASSTPAPSASAISVLISSSVTVLLGGWRCRSSQNTALVETSSSHTAGAAMRDSVVISGAIRQAMVSALRSARFFGTSSPTISER